MNGTDDYPEEADFDDDGEVSPLEAALDECGQTPDGGCALIGTEFCDFECPFRDEL